MTSQEDTRYLARHTLPDLIGQTIVKVLLHQNSIGDVFAGFETDKGTRVWVQANPEGNPGGFLAVEPLVETDIQIGLQALLITPGTGVR